MPPNMLQMMYLSVYNCQRLVAGSKIHISNNTVLKVYLEVSLFTFFFLFKLRRAQRPFNNPQLPTQKCCETITYIKMMKTKSRLHLHTSWTTGFHKKRFALLTLKTSRVLVAIAMIPSTLHQHLTIFLNNFVVTMSAELIFLDKTAPTEKPVAVTQLKILELSLSHS